MAVEGERAAPAEDRAFRPVELFTLGYLGVGLLLLLAFPGRASHAYAWAALHVALAAAIILARKSGLSRQGWGRVILAFYPVALFPLFYTEVGVLNRLLHPVGFHDDAILALEQIVFGGQPSRDLHRLLPWRPLGEYLHLSYFSYYFLVPTLAVVLYRKRSRAAFDTAIATVSLAFYASFLCFILFPTAGPYYVFPHSDPRAVGYLMSRLVRFLLDRGSSVGTAFPSSHVSVAFTVWIMAMRYDRKLAVILAFFVPTLAAGAVYGGYHYGVDILAGATVAVLVGTVGHAWSAALLRRADRAGARPRA